MIVLKLSLVRLRLDALHDTRPRIAPRTVRDRQCRRSGRHGRGLPGARHAARPRRRDQAAAARSSPRNAQFRARFEREAKSVSALNHPHICTLHDVGSASVKGEELHYLVMELVEGESLAQRLAKGPLPLDGGAALGAQIAAALDAAHRAGIVHRDLKPGNVMLTKAGAKLLDFGLAKARPGAASGRRRRRVVARHRGDRPLTEQGTIVGTFQYMAPEQLEGQPADARTDIFALGAVLYEMATGRKAFEGKTRTSLIAAIVSSQPPAISSVQGMTPAGARPRRAQVPGEGPRRPLAERARRRRPSSQWIAEGGSRAGLPGVVSTRRRCARASPGRSRASRWRSAALGFAVAWARRAPAARRRSCASRSRTPTGVIAVGPPVLSPDGRMLAFDAADATGKKALWLRPLDALEARPIPGTEGALRPIWSPDSRFDRLHGRREAAQRGRRRRAGADDLRRAVPRPTARGARDGVILFDGRGIDPIWVDRRRRRRAQAAVTPDAAKGERGVGWPAFLPGRPALPATRADGRLRRATR